MSSKEFNNYDTNDSGNGHPDVQRFARILFLTNQESQRFLIDTRVAIDNGDDRSKDKKKGVKGDQITGPLSKNRGIHTHKLIDLFG